MLLGSISNTPSLPCNDYTLFVCLCFQGRGCNKKNKNCITIRNKHRNCAWNKYFKNKKYLPIIQCGASSVFPVVLQSWRHPKDIILLLVILCTSWQRYCSHMHTHIYIHIHMETNTYCTIRKFQVPDHNNMLWTC